MYARRNKIVFLVENSLNNIAMRACFRNNIINVGVKRETRVYYNAKITNRFSTHNNCVIKTIAYTRIIGTEVHHRGLR